MQPSSPKISDLTNPQQGSSGISSDSSSQTGEHGQSRFTFVLDRNQRGLRTHAMRAHWQERRKRSQKDQSHHRTRRPLLAKPDSATEELDLAFRSSGTRIVPLVHTTTKAPTIPSADTFPVDELEYQHGQTTNNPDLGTERVIPQGIRAQVLSGLNYALSSSRLDPFEVFPVLLTATHHKLIHHCTIATHFLRLFVHTANFAENRADYACNYDVRSNTGL